LLSAKISRCRSHWEFSDTPYVQFGKLQKPMPLTACFAPLQIPTESAIINR
jgi:hypothetical protein